MQTIPFAMILFPVLLFCWKSYRERKKAYSLTRLFLYGEELPRGEHVRRPGGGG